MNHDNIPPDRIDPATGRIRSHKEMTAGVEEARMAARRAEILAEREAEAKKPELVKRIEMYERQVADARRNGDRDRAVMYREKLEELQDQYAAEQAAEKKAAMFAADRRIALIRERADILERSGAILYPNSPVELGTLIAIARSNDYPTPDAQYADFSVLADRLDDAALAAAQKDERDKGVAAAKAELDHAQSSVLVKEIELNREARRLADDGN